MLDGTVAHVLSDPPYSEHVHAKQWVGHALTKGRARLGVSEYAEIGFPAIRSAEMRAMARQCARLAARWVVLFSDVDQGCFRWARALEAFGLEHVRTGLWVKPDAAPQFTGDRPGSGAEGLEIAHRPGRKRWNGGGHHAVFVHCLNDYGRAERYHPTPKPVPLMLELVSLFTDPDEVVLDPFAGSGTTGVACLRLGRRCILVEKSPVYAALARERMEAEERGQTLREYRAGQIPLFSPGA